MSGEAVFQCDGYDVTARDLQQALNKGVLDLGSKLETFEPELGAQLLLVFNAADAGGLVKLFQRSSALFRGYYRHDGTHLFVDIDSLVASKMAGVKSMISSMCVSPEETVVLCRGGSKQ